MYPSKCATSCTPNPCRRALPSALRTFVIGAAQELKIKRACAILALLVVFLFGVATVHARAQDGASITGVVTDPTGAVIRGVSVALSSSRTGVTYHAVTNSAGAYRFVDIPAGPGYKETFTITGFAPLNVSDIYLNVASTRTQDARLNPGESQQVEVSASSGNVTINTTDATIGNNFEVQMLNDLPVQTRDSPATLFALQPGVAGSSVTGARTDQNNVTLDGLDVNDFATGSPFAIIGKAPVDSVQEFRGTTAGFTASSGPAGGGQFQLVTKSGTNSFHGDLNEYHRDTSTVANSWFNNNAGVPRAALIRNQFGGNVGGPIKRNKAFFFFNFYDSRIIQSSSVARTVPLDSLRAGNLSYINNTINPATGASCAAASRQNTTPTCISTLTPAQVAMKDPAGIGVNQTLLTFVNNRYPHANDLTLGDGINTGGYRFTTPTPDFETNYVGRIDYNLTSKITIYGRGTVNRENATESAVAFPADPATNPYIDRSWAWVVGMNWAIAKNKFNTAYYGTTVANLGFPNTYNPQGLNPLTFGDGTTTLLSNAYTSPVNAQGRSVPIPVIGDDFSWQKGRHSISFGGNFKDILSHSFTKLDYNTYTIGLGGEVLGLNSSLRPPDIRATGTTASNTYDSAFAFLLGRVGAINSNFNYNNAGMALPQATGDNRSYRYYQTELYAGDTWTVTPTLTLTYGLNYQLYSVPYEVHGFESVENFNFNDYFAARVAQSNAGESGNTAVPFISYVLGGKANHGPNLYNQDNKDFAPRFAFAFNPAADRKMVLNGSIGLVFDRTIVDAVQYQQDQYSYLFQQNQVTPFGTAGDPVNSLKNDPRIGANFALPAVTPPTAISIPDTPYVSGGVPYGLINGNAFNETIDHNLKTPYSMIFNVGIQHELPQHFVLKVNYVGRLGRRLLAQADANQIIDFADPASNQLLSSAFANVTTQIRAGADPATLPAQPWFEHLFVPGYGATQTCTTQAGVSIACPNNTAFLAYNAGGLPANGDFADFVQFISSGIPANVGMGSQFSENTFYTNKGFSTYHGLLVTLSKNLSHGLQFDANYTYSHTLDNTSIIANSPALGGYGFVCDVLRPNACYGNSDFDVKHYFTGDITYALPFGTGKMIGGKAHFLPNELIGGWSVSSIITAHTGNAFGTVSNAFVAGYANDAPALLVGSKSAVQEHTHKVGSQVFLFADQTAADNAFTGPVGFRIGARNNLRGPGYFNEDAGLAKVFPIIPDRGLNLKFRADAYNVFNHPSFAAPAEASSATDITNSNFGILSSTASAARVMQFALRLEF
jgi:hypothetical protein